MIEFSLLLWVKWLAYSELTTDYGSQRHAKEAEERWSEAQSSVTVIYHLTHVYFF